MKRRKFLKKIPLIAGAPFALQGIPINVFAKNNAFMRLAGQSTNDKVLVILNLDGGNDGLNTFIPVDQYDQYYSRRANIAIPAKNGVRKYIPLDSTLATPDQVGLHPDMIGIKELYDKGRMALVQGVSYKNNNGSHFRGRDIWFMGGDHDDYYSSGWVGRYLNQEYNPKQYPNDFPNAEMQDPLAIELGSDVSLVFHQEGNIPTSISLGGDPEGFAGLVGSLEGFTDQGIDPRGKPPEMLVNSAYEKELNWILNLEEKSEDYAARLLEVFEKSSPTSVTYPEKYPFNAPKGLATNRLTPQLQLIARLLEGGGAGLGVETKVFMVKIGGFDTHAEQVEGYDPTMGNHAALLHHISSAMKAFQDDLKARGLEDRVLTVTLSEFGRRIGSNGSYGTDHGTGGPIMIFGKGVKPGVTGTNPDVSKDNVEMQFDYRQVYANILKDWMEVSTEKIENEIFFGNFIDGPKEEGGMYEPLSLIRTGEITSTKDFVNARFMLENCAPNPANDIVNFSFHLNKASMVDLIILDVKGRTVKTALKEQRQVGRHEVQVNVASLPAGIYLYEIRAGLFTDTKKLIINR